MKFDIGTRGIALAVAVTIIMPLLLGVMFYPTAHMELKGLPFGVLSLDEGAQTPQGETNLGEVLVEKVQNGELASIASAPNASVHQETTSNEPSDANAPGGISDALMFTVFDSQEALDEAFANHEIYGALVIPANFSELQVKAMMAQQAAALAAQTGEATGTVSAPAPSPAAESTEAPNIEIVIDYAKSPLVASQLNMGIKGALGAPGMNTTLKMINEGPAQDMANTNMMAGMLSQMIVLMPLLICSIIAGALSVVSLKVRAGEHAAERAKRYAGSLALNAVASLVLSLMLYVVVRYVAGLEADMMPFVSYCWITALFLMTFFGGIGCIRGRLAAAVGVTILLLGITSAYLPFEALPAFWQDWITPWAPEFFMGNGLREVVFAGGSIWNQGTVATGIYACIGLFFGVLSVAVGNKASARRSA